MFLRRQINLIRAFLLDFYTKPAERGGFFSRLQVLLGLTNQRAVTAAAPKSRPEVLVPPTTYSASSIVSSSASSTQQAQPLATPVVNLNTNSKAAMHTTVVKAAAARTPMIKFLGARLPRPHYDSSKLPPLQITGFPPVTHTQTAAKATSIGPVGKIPRGQGIDESQLPLRYRRKPISEEECAAINNGGSYGL